MNKAVLSIFGSEWFGISISTLALAQGFILLFLETHYIYLKFVAESMTFLGLFIFIVIFILWILRGLTASGVRLSHWNNLTRLSFTALIPIVGFVLNYQLFFLFGFNNITAQLSLINYFFEYVLAFSIGIMLGYKLYTKEITQKEINYAIVIPPLSIGADIFLAAPLMDYFRFSYGTIIYFMSIMGIGIFFFLYIFIGSLALSGHVTAKHQESLPTTMLPVGIASLIVINLLTISTFSFIPGVNISLNSVKFISILLWGFELWNFIVVLFLILTNPTRGQLGIWAYGFPLGLFATSTIKILAFTKLEFMYVIFIIIIVVMVILWIYAWLNTYIVVHSIINIDKIGK